MILICDIGNTRIKSCFYEDDKTFNINSFATFEEFKNSVSNNNFIDCVFSSVVPEKTDLLRHFIKIILQKEPILITHNTDFNLEIDYKTPETLGIDRICSAEGAFYLFTKNGQKPGNNDFIVTVDFGTATTLNFINGPKTFVGGMILPGISMMFNSLSSNTAQLPEVTENDYNAFIGKDTKSSIASGVLNSAAGIIEKTKIELTEKYRAENIYFYITGGNAYKILPYLNINYEHVPGLVLTGIAAVYRNKR